ncbi:MAG: hypothetical protein CM15mP85_03070 [Rhodobacterales bacterium]|nr:MAG: hypothetical protein CM15mP85_03070 [Rhodobacterales bacterium]
MEKLRNKYIQAIKSADDEAALETVRLAALGKKGEVSLKMRELGQMSSGRKTECWSCTK